MKLRHTCLALLVACSPPSPPPPEPPPLPDAGTGTGGGGATPAGFTARLSAETVTLDPGGSATLTLTLTRTGGFAGIIRVTVLGLPAGVTELTTGDGDTRTLKLSALASTAPGHSDVTVHLESESVDRDYPLGLDLRAPRGAPDESFGQHGQLLSAAPSYLAAAAAQPDGRLVLAGSSPDAAGDLRVTIVRLLADGTPDPGFGAAGRFTGSPGRSSALLLRADGTLVVAAGPSLLALSASGAPLPGFGAAPLEIAALAEAPGGRVLAAGAVPCGTGCGTLAVAGFTADGRPDATFGANGLATATFGKQGYATSLALQADGKILAGGAASSSPYAGAQTDFALARFTAAGVVDATFGDRGTVLTAFSDTSDDVAYGLVVQPDGRIVLGGAASLDTSGRPGDFAFARYTLDGRLDPAFGSAGRARLDLANGARDGAYALAYRDGLIAAGVSMGDTADLVVLRLTASGDPDPSFAPGGRVLLDFEGRDDLGRALAVQPDGRLVAAGHSSAAGSSTWSSCVARLWP